MSSNDFERAIQMSIASKQEEDEFALAVEISRASKREKDELERAMRLIRLSEQEDDELKRAMELSLAIEVPQQKEQDVPHDGNCYFHCLRIGLEFDIDVASIRQLVVGYVVERFDYYESSPYLENRDLFGWIDSMSRDTVFGDILAIEAACKRFQVPISVRFRAGTVYTEPLCYGTEFAAKPIELVLHNNHYTILV
jgi:hypothetical protein